MRPMGFGLIAIGMVWLLIAWKFGTSITALSPIELVSSTALFDSIFQREYHLIISSLIILAGLLAVIYSLHNQPPDTKVADQYEWIILYPRRERDLANEAYRSWLIKKYDIEQNKLFRSFYFQQQTFSSLERALSAAHTLDVVEEDAMEWAERRSYEKARVDAAEAALAKQTSFDRNMIIIIGAISLAIISATLFRVA